MNTLSCYYFKSLKSLTFKLTARLIHEIHRNPCPTKYNDCTVSPAECVVVNVLLVHYVCLVVS